MANFYSCIEAGKYYNHRKDLNETILGPGRVFVNNFIDNRHLSLLEKFFFKHRSTLFEKENNAFRLHNFDELLYQLFPNNNPPVCFVNNLENTCISVADQAIKLIKSKPTYHLPTELVRLNFTASEILSATETWVHIRNKIYEFASEVYNTTAYPAEASHGVFYYFPPKSIPESNVNGVEYLYSPHFDVTPFQGIYDRPIRFQKVSTTMYRKFTAVLYFTDVSSGSGGNFQYMDLMNHDTLPPSKGHIHENPGKRPTIKAGFFVNETIKITRVWPRRGRLLLLNANNLHSVPLFTGEFERWAYCIFMTDAFGEDQKLRGIEPDWYKEIPDPTVRPSHSRKHIVT